MKKAIAARLAIALLLAIFSGRGVDAQEDSIDCTSPQTQADMTQCAYQDFEEADKELNAIYKKAMASQIAIDKEAADTGPEYVEAAKALKKAQRAWIGYRDGHCQGIGYQAAGGTMQPMLEQGCRATITRIRTKELQILANGLGN